MPQSQNESLASGPVKFPTDPDTAPLSRDPADLGLPGIVVELDPETAIAMGAFREEALNIEEAWEANADIASWKKGT